ncbi:hypothetical protein TSAR_013065 [Trichomalopsis sarcophagae]|uniref:Uncharacterized protein n=1 Tax=Trichomalopsis sarcophagae TaxID=543379 RepID=A0A232FN03_9HYME|nr:hypothetical protein TSAR_013065 [Trichomalopsis sarcophagae]
MLTSCTHQKRLIHEHALFLVRFGAIHHLENSDTWLDVFLIDSETKLKLYEKSAAPFINGHHFLMIDYAFDTPKIKPKESVTRDFRRFSSE